MNKYLLGGAVATALVVIAPAIAQTPAPAPAAPQIQDHLGEPGWQGRERPSIHTRAEVAAHVRTMFDRLDGNHDGAITKAEAEAVKVVHRDRIVKRMHRHFGAGGQGTDRGAMFNRMDANRDGSISRAEFDALHAQRRQRLTTRDQDADGRPDVRRMGGRHRMGGMGGQMFELADGNRDGRVTLQEATIAALRRFDTADVNRDGQLTPEERRQMHLRLRAERKPG